MDFYRLFQKRRKEVAEARPDLRITLHIGKPSEFPKTRDYAYCAWNGHTCEIVFAPKIEKEAKATQDALIRHELAHAMLTSADLPHSERECDAVAEEFWGDPIYYDPDDVQTLESGTRPRPRHLPNPGKEYIEEARDLREQISWRTVLEGSLPDAEVELKWRGPTREPFLSMWEEGWRKYKARHQWGDHVLVIHFWQSPEGERAHLKIKRSPLDEGARPLRNPGEL
jgi:hypothetical protein